MFDFIMYFCCYLSGLFLGVMIFTIIENASKGFRQFVRKMCQAVPFFYRRIINLVSFFVFCFIGFYYIRAFWGTTMSGVVFGMIGGIFMYFKAGVTLGNNPDPYNQERKRKMKKLKNK